MKKSMTICGILFGILLLLNVYDGYSTTILMKAGAREANPTVEKVIEAIGIIPGIIAVKVFFLGIFVCSLLLVKTNREYRIVVFGLAFLIGWYSTSMYFINYELMTSIN